MIYGAHPSWKRYDNVRSSGENPSRSTRSTRRWGGVHVHSVGKSSRRPVRTLGDLTHLCTHEPLYYGEQGPGMVVFEFTSRPYTRVVAQPYGLAGNALGLHCRTLSAASHPYLGTYWEFATSMRQQRGGGSPPCCLIILAGTTTTITVASFGILEWALYYMIVLAPSRV